MAGLVVDPLSIYQIRKFCKRLKTLLNIPFDDYVEIVKIFEHTLTRVGVEFEIATIDEMGTKHGETIPQENKVRIREDVYERACVGYGRDRLTIAHELGHLLLHSIDKIKFARDETAIPAYKDPEWQANAFAGELLAPYECIQGMTLEDISLKYGVTEKAAAVQRNRKR